VSIPTNINNDLYCEHVLSLVKDYMDLYPGLVFQQDNTGLYAAAMTTFQFIYACIEVIK